MKLSQHLYKLAHDGSSRMEAELIQAARRAETLEVIMTEAIPFIGYQAHVPELLERAEKSVDYATEGQG